MAAGTQNQALSAILFFYERVLGRDLQFIRINGTVVGALAGLVIYSVAQLLF